MILPVQQALRARIARAVDESFPLTPGLSPSIAIEYPPDRSLGDLATPVAFELARHLKRPPRVIAQELAAKLDDIADVSVTAAPNGYLNLFLDRRSFLMERVAPRAPLPVQQSRKTIVEHTAINPNKAAHVGHLRNSALGDTLVRVLRFRGVPVEVQNYIDDTGVQVADVVVGFEHLEGKTLDEVRSLSEKPRFDYYCWDLYARVTEWYEADAARLAHRAAALHALETGGNDSASMAGFIADRIVRRHLETMARMNVGYDLLTFESHILALHFWTRAFEILKSSSAVFLQTRGKLAGCWVMRIQDDVQTGSSTEAPPDNEGTVSEEEPEKVIVRSNGTVTYVGKDIANQLWKFGLLGRDFHYRVFDVRGDDRLWATSQEQTAEERAAPQFGRASAVYNVIDVRQSYLQKLLKQALQALGYPSQAEHSTHFAYEMVALSPDTARALGYLEGESEDSKKTFVEVSGRKGQGVKADDLLDRLVARAQSEVSSRNPDFSTDLSAETAAKIAVAAVRYFMIKYSRTKVIAFDIDEALSFEGETGPYLQYAVVRANNIFHKLRERDGLGEEEITLGLDDVPSEELLGQSGSHDLWSLVLEASRLDEVVEQVVRTLEFSVLAKYAFALAQAFNAYYHRFSILNEENVPARRWRAAGVRYVRNQLALSLDLMGIEVPARM
jgi:arginyl-tRNA synthetase